MKHVIIGNGPAGVVAAETLRKQAPADEVVLIGDESELPYSRMAIPYFLIGDIPDVGTHLRKTDDHFERNGIALLTGRVSRLEPQAHQIHFADGRSMAYDRLLLATGCHPVRPPVAGMDLPGVHTCWTLNDARAIAARASAGSRVVQIGAGFIGCIIMEALSSRGVDLTVVEMGDRMVPRMMTEKAGTMIRHWVEAKGVHVHVNTTVMSITQNGDALAVLLSNGDTLLADLVICAAGVRPNVALLVDSGIEIGQGIRVDERMQTCVPDIFAAGDVTEAAGFHSGAPELNAIQPAATDQARVAAINMAGGAARFQGALAINVLDTLGLISTSFGQWWGTEGGQGVELMDEAHHRYVSLQFDGDVVVGATCIGWTSHVGALRGLVQGRMKLGPWKDRLLLDPTQFAAAYVACARKAA
jgi:NAD(P)H-nitrite reductase large subunit